MASVFYEIRTEPLFTSIICDHPFPSHMHDVVEVVCLNKGTIDLTVSKSKHRLCAGDILIIFPSQIHSYDSVANDVEGLTMMFPPDTISQYGHAFRTLSPVSPVLKKDVIPIKLRETVEHLLELTYAGSGPVRLGYLHLFLAYLFSCLQLEQAEKQVQNNLSSQVLRYIADHFTEPLSLESTAHALGISSIHLSHLFSQQLKINFRQHINSLRIERACTLLHDPSYTISQVAEMCGYANLRTFHRAFQTQCGMPPNQYRSRLAP